MNLFSRFFSCKSNKELQRGYFIYQPFISYSASFFIYFAIFALFYFILFCFSFSILIDRIFQFVFVFNSIYIYISFLFFSFSRCHAIKRALFISISPEIPCAFQIHCVTCSFVIIIIILYYIILYYIILYYIILLFSFVECNKTTCVFTLVAPNMH